MEHVLGLDGGGTKTDLAVIDCAGSVISRRQMQGLDPTKGPEWEAVLAGIATTVGPVTTAVLGLPFHGEVAQISARQTEIATSLFGASACVMNDVAVAFDGAFAGADGVLVLAGTGSMAWSRGPLGVHRVGGWGECFGDEGSAFWIGREALRQISQQLDGRRPRTTFADAMLSRIGIGANDLIGWTYGLANKRALIAALAVTVSALARAGDADAAALMTKAASHLSHLGLTAQRLCGLALGWSFAGGVMNDAVVRDGLTKAMGAAPVAPILPPVGGAVLAAARAAGWETGDDFIARLKVGLTDEMQRP